MIDPVDAVHQDLPFCVAHISQLVALLLLASACSSASVPPIAEPTGWTEVPGPPPAPPVGLDRWRPAIESDQPTAPLGKSVSLNQLDRRWRPAIENYSPSVQLGNTTALNTARVPFATYLVAMHNRIHPIFADEFLRTLNSLPKGNPLDQDLRSNLEIVLDKDTGKVVRMGVIKVSGVTAFDIAALSAVNRAAPFGKAPDAIASPDGNVYLHWEFHRDPVDACTTRNAWPFILKSAPSGVR